MSHSHDNYMNKTYNCKKFRRNIYLVFREKKYWANAFFKKNFMAHEWVEKKSCLQQIAQPSPPLPCFPWDPQK